MNVGKQVGGVDCGLYAIAFITHLALGKDPTSIVFSQADLRPRDGPLGISRVQIAQAYKYYLFWYTTEM